MAFDLSGNIVETDDGGVYRRSAPTTNAGDWTSAGGTAGGPGSASPKCIPLPTTITAHRPRGHSGQRKRSNKQLPGRAHGPQSMAATAGPFAFSTSSPIVNSFRYSSNEPLRQFERRESLPLGAPVGPAVYPALHVVDTIDKTLTGVSGSRFDTNVSANTTLAVNRVNPDGSFSAPSHFTNQPIMPRT